MNDDLIAMLARVPSFYYETLDGHAGYRI